MNFPNRKVRYRILLTALFCSTLSLLLISQNLSSKTSTSIEITPQQTIDIGISTTNPWAFGQFIEGDTLTFTVSNDGYSDVDIELSISGGDDIDLELELDMGMWDITWEAVEGNYDLYLIIDFSPVDHNPGSLIIVAAGLLPIWMFYIILGAVAGIAFIGYRFFRVRI
jgi:hypothetical protein